MSTEMSSSIGSAVSAAARLRTRIAAILVLALTAGGLGWLGVNVYHIFNDAWVAPLHLSPDSDRVVGLRLQLNRQESEMARVEAEVSRIDGDIGAIDAGIERLTSMYGDSQESMVWEASVRSEEADSIERMIDNLTRQRTLLSRLYDRQESLTEETRDDLASGLVSRDALRSEEQALDALALSRAENERQLEEARLREREALIASQAYRTELGDSDASDQLDSNDNTTDLPDGQMPEVAAGAEREVRIELELIQLQSERRGLMTLRAAAVQRLDEERELLDEIQTRPLYRAIHRSTNVGFVPYEELDGVEPGWRVMVCVWNLFACHQVGTVLEVLPGEAITEDPWGDLARGQFAILDLDDSDAIREKVLRVRPAE